MAADGSFRRCRRKLDADGWAGEPTIITRSLPKGARMQGLRATGFGMKSGSVTGVKTTQGEIALEKMLNAGGQRARQNGATAGVNAPLHPIKHHFVMTEPITRVPALTEVGVKQMINGPDSPMPEISFIPGPSPPSFHRRPAEAVSGRDGDGRALREFLPPARFLLVSGCVGQGG